MGGGGFFQHACPYFLTEVRERRLSVDQMLTVLRYCLIVNCILTCELSKCPGSLEDPIAFPVSWTVAKTRRRKREWWEFCHQPLMTPWFRPLTGHASSSEGWLALLRAHTRSSIPQTWMAASFGPLCWDSGGSPPTLWSPQLYWEGDTRV